MARRLIDIIPLDALRVFEACARQMSFTAAANELSVTQAAVSRRIKNLENLLGIELFQRHGKKLKLTPSGNRLFRHVQVALDYLSHEIEELSHDGNTYEKPIQVSAAPAISDLWLSEKLKDYCCSHADASVRLLTSRKAKELSNSENGISILFAPDLLPDWNMSILFTEELIPVAAPGYLEKAGLRSNWDQLGPDDVVQLDLFDYERSNINSISLKEWFQQIGRKDLIVRPKFVYTNYALAVASAARGDGVVLGCRNMISGYLKRKQLVELGSTVLNRGFSYYVGFPRNIPVSDNVWNLAEFLLAQARLNNLK
ncbi:LysR family transcriptional regulator [Rhodophyticola sp. CCM32]|uniref:LysR family transcriptional regulator n=1 Tax=Rhodophyticola sp. CCM32 TaxID=2916397 RepID=UPI00107F4686|nr:LysR family transcriptional regulator [Rhodophyticola sp. CCM32]QBY01725.1 LysR family transcriptional regulator [Rhodophyticola sp. CCM32]